MATKVTKTTQKKDKHAKTSKRKDVGARVAKKKSSSTKKVKKKVVNSPASKTLKNKVPDKKTFSSSTPVQSVNLPTNMSLAQKQKAEVMKLDIHEYIHRSVNITAFISAICFLVVGTMTVLSSVHTNNLVLSANIITSEITKENTTETHVETDVDPDNSQPEVKFYFLDKLPSTITTDLTVGFVASGIERVQAKLVRADSQSFIKLEVSNLLNNKYRTVIPSTSIDPGYYELRVYLQTRDDQFNMVEATGEFYIGKKDITEDNIAPEGSGTETENSFIVEIKEASVATDNSSSTQIYDKEIMETSPTSTVESFKAITNPEFDLGHTENILTELVTIKVINPGDALDFIELYARPYNSRHSQFITLAKERSEGWFFEVNTKNLPNGRYELYAVTKVNGNTLKTKHRPVYIENKTTDLPNTEDLSLNIIAKEASSTEREFITTQEYKLDNATTSELQDQISDLIHLNSYTLDNDFKRYATALQAGDELLIKQAINNIEATQEVLAKEVILNEDRTFLADDIDRELQNRIQSLRVKIEEFEKIRQERSSGNTSIDTDGDGISDIDEVKIFNTNPLSPDTDNDGINDGVEIVDGYDPSNSSPEAVVVFESPTSTVGLEKSDHLSIEAIRPILSNSVERGANRFVKTEITGRGLPLSFVTIYIFSSPTIVTIKTESDGSFVYTFDKELEDGEHNVYVAMTNNSGSIIAQSSPFSFVKEAEAFSFTVENENKTVTAADNHLAPVSQTYNIVLGFSVLILGTILLALGFGMRRKDSTRDLDVHSTASFYAQK